MLHTCFIVIVASYHVSKIYIFFKLNEIHSKKLHSNTFLIYYLDITMMLLHFSFL